MWKCLNCGESLNDIYDLCWRCGADKEGKVLPPSLTSENLSVQGFEDKMQNKPHVSLENKLRNFKAKIEKNGILGTLRGATHYSKITEADNETMRTLLTKYVKNKCVGSLSNMMPWFKENPFNNLIESNSLEKLKLFLKDSLIGIESSSSFDSMETMLETKIIYESISTLTHDIEKLYKLFEKKSIETDYPAIISLLAEISASEAMADLEKNIDILLGPILIAIPKVLGTNATIEDIIKYFMKLSIYKEQFDNDGACIIIVRLLVKLGFEFDSQEALDTTQEDIRRLIKEIEEERELDEFEQSVVTGRKNCHELENYEKLNGYEFEGYLKKLFTNLEYTVIQTSLSGDQGADLIMSKDSKKIVVQAKKYIEKVTNKAIQEVIAAKNYYKADEAIVVTNSSFTGSAIELALKCNVELWDGKKLNGIIASLSKSKKDLFELKKGELLYESEKTEQKITGICPSCNDKFECLVSYENMQDSNAYQFDCPKCGMTNKIVVGSFHCPFCSKQFEKIKELKNHVEVCDKNKDEKKFNNQ